MSHHLRRLLHELIHDLKTPLSVIATDLEFIQSEVGNLPVREDCGRPLRKVGEIATLVGPFGSYPVEDPTPERISAVDLARLLGAPPPTGPASSLLVDKNRCQYIAKLLPHPRLLSVHGATVIFHYQPHEGSQKPRSIPDVGRPARGESIETIGSEMSSARRRPLSTGVSGNPPDGNDISGRGLAIPLGITPLVGCAILAALEEQGVALQMGEKGLVAAFPPAD